MTEELKTLKDMEIKLFVEDFKRGKVSCDIVDSNGKVSYLGEYYEEDVPKGSNIIAKIKEANCVSGKTLVDFSGDRLIDSKELRAEAIKWIKEFEEPTKGNTLDKDGYFIFCDCVSGSECSCSQGAITFIKKFFNITEADLK
jgi:hypothetical protein